MIKFDLNSSLREKIFLMDKYGNSITPYDGTNEIGEPVLISISDDNITVRTYQKNNIIRINTYWRDGIVEELFETC